MLLNPRMHFILPLTSLKLRPTAQFAVWVHGRGKPGLERLPVSSCWALDSQTFAKGRCRSQSQCQHSLFLATPLLAPLGKLKSPQLPFSFLCHVSQPLTSPDHQICILSSNLGIITYTLPPRYHFLPSYIYAQFRAGNVAMMQPPPPPSLNEPPPMPPGWIEKVSKTHNRRCVFLKLDSSRTGLSPQLNTLHNLHYLSVPISSIPTCFALALFQLLLQ